MSAFEINLTPEDIEALVKRTIMESGFGRAVEDAVKKVLNRSYDNPIENQIALYVATVARELLNERLAPKIRELVVAQMEAMVTDDVLAKVTGGVVRKMMEKD